MSSEHAHGHSNAPLFFMLGATFVFGFVAGVIAFFVSHTGEEGGGDAIEAPVTGFAVSAYEYGACTNAGACASYHIAGNGTYTYLVRSREHSETKYEDALNKKQHGALTQMVNETTFETIGKMGQSGDCAAESYRFEIEYTGKRYSYDSCVHSIARIALFDTLEDYFNVFRVLYGVE